MSQYSLGFRQIYFASYLVTLPSRKRKDNFLKTEENPNRDINTPRNTPETSASSNNKKTKPTQKVGTK
jgi:hypothetical protein